MEFAEHELRDHEDAVEKAGFRDIGDAAVDDDAGIENLEALLGRFFTADLSKYHVAMCSGGFTYTCILNFNWGGMAQSVRRRTADSEVPGFIPSKVGIFL